MSPDALNPPTGLTPVNPRGIWDRIAIYERADLVTWQGSSYIAVTQNIGSEPVWYSGVWQTVAEKGEPGLSLKPRGIWSRTTIYETRDVVSYDGESWIAVRASVGVYPHEGLDWQELARQGTPGGGQGPRGDTGATGAIGPPGAGSTVIVNDEGVLQGVVSTLDFVGAAITASVVGAMATITVTASATVLEPQRSFLGV